MQALGFIETRGLLAAVECADTMVKAADVTILEKVYVGGGLVTVSVTGDVGAVKAAVEAGVAAVRKLSESLLISENVIPRPHEELNIIIGEKPSKTEIESSSNEEDVEAEIEEIEQKQSDEYVSEVAQSDKNDFDADSLDINALSKSDVDELFKTEGIEKTVEVLSKLKLSKLRNLAREYKEFSIKGRTISKADKNMLINEFKAYYK